jgi:hypothetical protein
MIHSRTEGHSLFVTTLAQLLAERGDIELLEGRWTLSRPLAELTLEVPPSVMSMIRKQLEGLSEDDRHVLECASIQGEEFLSVPVAEALSQDELAVEERLERLARTHGIVKSVSEATRCTRTFCTTMRCRGGVCSCTARRGSRWSGTTGGRRRRLRRSSRCISNGAVNSAEPLTI